MFKKKGQAAMEFLMTYGWAILVVLVAIGALAYFGVLSPDKFLPERCQGPSGVDSIDKAAIKIGVAGTGYVELVAKNNLGFDITILDHSAPTTGDYDATGTADIGTIGTAEGVGHILGNYSTDGGTPGPVAAVVAAGFDVENGEKFAIKIYSTDTAITKGRFKSDITIWYQNDETGLYHPAVYSITGIAG